jgi:hypothetical protein
LTVAHNSKLYAAIGSRELLNNFLAMDLMLAIKNTTTIVNIMFLTIAKKIILE